jgi:type VI secretion system protein ImpC
MTEAGPSERLIRGSTLGDALRALERLRPADSAVASALLAALGIKSAARPATGVSIAGDLPVDVSAPPPDRSNSSGATSQRTLSDTDQLPPIVSSAIEEVGTAGAAPPQWLADAPLIPLPVTLPNPFRRYDFPLFEPKWQRAIITKLASVTMPLGEPDLERVVDRIASGQALLTIPRRGIPTTAKGLQMLIDQGDSLEPFRLDVAELVRAFRRTIGPARVAVQSFRGLPEWGCAIGIEWANYRLPPAGTSVVVVSDLGLAPCPPTAIAASTSDWRKFFGRLARQRHRCAVVVPRDSRELRPWVRPGAQLVPWDRRTLASRLEHPSASKSSGADAKTTEHVVSLNEIGRVGHYARELACVASLAARIEPQLLRLLRLQLTPGAPVSAEAELWFSDLVAERAATGIVLIQPHRETLQRLLRVDRERLDRAYALIESLHRDSAPALRIEEELTYRSLIGDVDRARVLLRSLVATLIAPQRPGVSRWLTRALVRMPRGLMTLEEAQMLALGTALRTGETTPLPEDSATGGGGWHWLKPSSSEVEVSINWRRGAIEFGPRTMRGAHQLRVPDSNPVLIELISGSGTTRPQRVRLNPTTRTLVEIDGDVIEISVVGGGSWRLREAEVARARKASSQKFAARNRAPRVQIEYEVEMYGAIKKHELPFVIGVMSDLSGDAAEPLPPVEERKFREIDVDNFDERMKAVRPRAALRVPNRLTGEGDLAVDLVFNSMDEFTPGAVARKVEPLRMLLEARTQLRNLLVYMDDKPGAEELIGKLLKDPQLQQSLAGKAGPTVDGAPENQQDSSMSESSGEGGGINSEMFADLLQQRFAPKTDPARADIQRAVGTLAEQALTHAAAISGDAVESIQAIMAEIDRKLTEQINLILHHERFQQIESAWRGLSYLVTNTETGPTLKLRVLDISKSELLRSIQDYSGETWDQSPIFKKVYEEEFGVFGGEPFGCLVGDYHFDHNPADVALLGQVAQIAAAAHAPFLAAAAPSLLHMESWQELANPRDLSRISSTPEYSSWRSFRESGDARYVGLTLPRFLTRLPYGAKTNPIEEFEFEEQVDGAGSSKYVWANSAYAMAANIARSFALFGWGTSIRGVESGGSVEGLPVHVFPADDGGVDSKCPTEIAISDRREAELSSNGLMPLLHRKNTDLAVFISAASVQKPPDYTDPEATANARLAARLPYLLACCRFAHYLQCMVRDKIGRFSEPADLQRFLASWLMQYVAPDPSLMGDEDKARRPLAEAAITVDAAESAVGNYSATLLLRPHYRLEGLTTPLRMTLRLPGHL